MHPSHVIMCTPQFDCAHGYDQYMEIIPIFQSSEAIGILIVHPASPYLDWARTMCDDEIVLSVIGKSPTAYIVPEAETKEELESYRDEWFPQIFHEELNSWCRDVDLWPQDRSWNRFKEWFTWTWHPMVFNTRANSIPRVLTLLGGYQVEIDEGDWLDHLLNAIVGEAMPTVSENPPERDQFWFAVHKQCELDLAYVAGQLHGKSSLTPAYLLSEFYAHWDRLEKKLSD